MSRIKLSTTILLLAAAPATAFGFQQGQAGAAPGRPPAQEAPRAAEGKLDDRLFALVAAESGEVEVAAARIALERASGEEVKKFAQQMVEDHTRANGELMSAAQAAQVAARPELSPAKRAELLILASKSGPEFDHAYAEQQLAAHICAVALFRAEAELGQAPELKQFAAETRPKLEHHLQMARGLAGAGGSHGIDRPGTQAEPAPRPVPPAGGARP